MSSNGIVIPDHLRKLINKVCQEFGLEREDGIETKLPTQPGDNWLGIILDVHVVGKNRSNEPIAINVIAKLAPTYEAYRNFFLIRSCYEREVHMYNSVLPEFAKLQEENNVENVFAPFAKCYQTHLSEPNETLILENMNNLGYKTISHKLPLDYQHASLVMKMLGKFHALSFAIREQKPELMNQLSVNTKDAFLSGFKENYMKVIGKLGTQVLSYLDQGSSAYTFFKQFVEDPSSAFDLVSDPEKFGPYGVICYGDPQTRNVLFRYDNKDNLDHPTDACFLDFQLSRFGSPCTDIWWFLWTCTNTELRSRHYEDLLDDYYNSFSSFLIELRGDPEKSFPVSVFKKHLKRYSVFGVCAAIWVIWSNLTDPTNVPNAYEANSIDSIIDMFGTITNDLYFSRITEVVQDFVKYGYAL